MHMFIYLFTHLTRTPEASRGAEAPHRPYPPKASGPRKYFPDRRRSAGYPPDYRPLAGGHAHCQRESLKWSWVHRFSADCDGIESSGWFRRTFLDARRGEIVSRRSSTASRLVPSRICLAICSSHRAASPPVQSLKRGLARGPAVLPVDGTARRAHL